MNQVWRHLRVPRSVQRSIRRGARLTLLFVGIPFLGSAQLPFASTISTNESILRQPAPAPEPVEPSVESVPEYVPRVDVRPTMEPHRNHDCHRYLGRRVCEGPLTRPFFGDTEADVQAQERAALLRLGEVASARIALYRVVPETWKEAVQTWIASRSTVRPPGLVGPEGVADETLLSWPVPAGHWGRGFGIMRRVPSEARVTRAERAIAARRNRRGRPARRGRHKPHEGIDIMSASGSAITAMRDGLVVYAGNQMSGYGNSVVLVHADGEVTLYAHARALWVREGQLVERGQTIAEVGATGLAHGAHLHFESHRDGHAIDPAPRLVGRPAYSRTTTGRRGHRNSEELNVENEEAPTELAASALGSENTGREGIDDDGESIDDGSAAHAEPD